MRIFIFLALIISQPLIAQKKTVSEFAAIDTKALQLPDSLSHSTTQIARYINTAFTTENEKTRAIFIWVASNLSYDLENVFAINFYEKREEKINKAIRTRKGLCENYAALFDDICKKAGIKSFVIEGYTLQKGFTDYIPHAWCAARVDSAWFLFDPTWGSGYVNGGKFIKKINDAYFKTNPLIIIKSHMPFDYLWQFRHYPITNQEFYEGKIEDNKLKPYFNFSDSIRVFENQPRLEQLTSVARRVSQNGIRNSMIFDRLQHIRMDIENERNTALVNTYNAAAAEFNDGINDYNVFIQYRNNKFTPAKPDPEIHSMLETPKRKIQSARLKLESLNITDTNINTLKQQLLRSIETALAGVEDQQQWLAQYFSKGKAARKMMFYERRN